MKGYLLPLINMINVLRQVSTSIWAGDGKCHTNPQEARCTSADQSLRYLTSTLPYHCSLLISGLCRAFHFPLPHSYPTLSRISLFPPDHSHESRDPYSTIRRSHSDKVEKMRYVTPLKPQSHIFRQHFPYPYMSDPIVRRT